MKFKHLIITIVILSTFLTKAQMSDLAELMGNKELVSWDNIYNTDDSLYGMILFYKGDKIDKKHRQFEYLIFDKNLNLIAKNTFSQRTLFLTDNRFSASKNIDNTILLHIDYGAFTKNVDNYLFNTYRKIDLNKNTITDEFYFDGNKIQTISNLGKIGKKLMSEWYELIPLKVDTTSGYLALKHYKKYKENYKVNQLRFLDNDNQLRWTFHYNKNANRKSYQKLKYIYLKDDMAVVKFFKYDKKKFSGTTLVGLDLTNGQKLFEHQLGNTKNKNNKYTHNVDAIKKYGNNIYITGQYFKKYALGIYKITLDVSGKELFKKYVPWQAFSKYLKINKYGKVENGYILRTRDFFIFRDGSISYLSEKYKVARYDSRGYAVPKTTDMVLMNFDKDFNVKDAITIRKTKSFKSFDYLFSQYVKNNTGCVFFFKNFKKDWAKKDKVGILGINKYIDSHYSYEEIPIYSKKEKYMIIPIKAKEGYIILREFNKDDEYDQIRLEKINL